MLKPEWSRRLSGTVGFRLSQASTRFPRKMGASVSWMFSRTQTTTRSIFAYEAVSNICRQQRVFVYSLAALRWKVCNLFCWRLCPVQVMNTCLVLKLQEKAITAKLEDWGIWSTYPSRIWASFLALRIEKVNMREVYKKYVKINPRVGWNRCLSANNAWLPASSYIMNTV